MAYLTPEDVLKGFHRHIFIESSKQPYESGSIFAFFTDIEAEVQKGKSLDWGSSIAGIPEPRILLFAPCTCDGGAVTGAPPPPNSVWGRHLEVTDISPLAFIWSLSAPTPRSIVQTSGLGALG